MSWNGRYRGWAPYVPVAKRRAQAANFAASLAKKEKRELAPIRIPGNRIATTFWGKGWCENLEQYCDEENRLPRGRTYARNGSVIDLQIEKGVIKSLVSGSDVYQITINIDPLAASAWHQIKQDCSQSIDSLLDLLQGKFDQGIMERLVQQHGGLFPQPKEIKMRCSCPDSAGLCKHIAATMYGVGHRLDTAPELLFHLRAVDHIELIANAITAKNLNRTFASPQENALVGSDLGELFGIELSSGNIDTKTESKAVRTKTMPVKTLTRPVKKTAKTAKKVIATEPQQAEKRAANSKRAPTVTIVPQTKPRRKLGKRVEVMAEKKTPSTSTRLMRQSAAVQRGDIASTTKTTVKKSKKTKSVFSN